MSLYGLVELEGRETEEIFFWENFEVRDTNYYGVTKELSKYREIRILAKNTHDQDLLLDFRDGATPNTSFQFFNGATFERARISLTKGTVDYIDITTKYCELKSCLKSLNLVVSNTTTAPTSGNLTIKVVGVPN